MISDEAHHMNTLTKKKFDKDDEKNKNSWEYTVMKILGLNRENMLLEYTATMDDKNSAIIEKYSDKLIYKYDLKAFRAEGWSKEIDIINSTLGKALGGGAGGYTTASQDIIGLLRQKSRPYLFSNSLMPSAVLGALEVFKLLENSDAPVRLNKTVKYFRQSLRDKGFKISGNDNCPIVPIMIGNEKIATELGLEMEAEGIYVVGFCYPVVPKGQARIRVQITAGHTKDQMDKCINAFEKLGKKKGII